MWESPEAENPAFTLRALLVTKSTKVTQSISWCQHHSHLEEGLLTIPLRMLCHFSGCLYLDVILKNIQF